MTRTESEILASRQKIATRLYEVVTEEAKIDEADDVLLAIEQTFSVRIGLAGRRQQSHEGRVHAQGPHSQHAPPRKPARYRARTTTTQPAAPPLSRVDLSPPAQGGYALPLRLTQQRREHCPPLCREVTTAAARISIDQSTHQHAALRGGSNVAWSQSVLEAKQSSSTRSASERGYAFDTVELRPPRTCAPGHVKHPQEPLAGVPWKACCVMRLSQRMTVSRDLAPAAG